MLKRTKSYGEWRLAKLSDPARAARYLNAAKKDSKEALLRALKNVIQANQVTRIAREANISRESVYRSFSTDGNPTFDRLWDVFKALNIDFDFSAMASSTVSSGQSGPDVDAKPKLRSLSYSDKKQTLAFSGMPVGEAGIGSTYSLITASGTGRTSVGPVWEQAASGKLSTNALSPTVTANTTSGIYGLIETCVIAERSQSEEYLNLAPQEA